MTGAGDRPGSGRPPVGRSPTARLRDPRRDSLAPLATIPPTLCRMHSP